MKRLICIIKLLCLVGSINAQYADQCFPQDLMVTGHNVNFRAEPNTNSAPIGIFTNGERVRFINLVNDNNNRSWNWLTDNWVSTERIATGEQGFVFGNFVKPQEMAYSNGSDCDRIQEGYWYGIYQEDDKVIIEKSTPSIRESRDGHLSIAGGNQKHRLLICSQTQLTEGPIKGKFFDPHGEVISIGKKVDLLRIQNNLFSLVCTGEVALDEYMTFSRFKERIYFVIEEMDGSKRHYSKQDLTNCINKFGETGYTLIFTGDINNDGIPEVIFSEGTNRESMMYYFKSNKDGELELKSVAYSSSKC